VRGLVALALALNVCAACAGSARLTPEGGFAAVRGREHPLIGKIWSRTAGALIEPDELVASVRRSSTVAIGESHDHVDHHRLQAWLIARWLPAQRSPAVALEMLDESQAAALEPTPTSANELAARVKWDESGWPEFALYRPLFEAALRGGAAIIAAHPRREQVRASMAGIAPEQRAALALEEPLPAVELAALTGEIRDSHCGHATEPMVAGMVQAQSFKDAWMARAIADAKRPVLLIAGNGHISEARGVPLFLARRGVRDVLTIALVEVSDQKTRPQDYDVRDVDIALFTPRMSDADPCEAFRAQLEQMRARRKAP
jgi:uncharacterized iron-regulated protein